MLKLIISVDMGAAAAGSRGHIRKGRPMKYLYDQAILLLYCLCSLFFVTADPGFVIAVFFAVAVSAALDSYPQAAPGLSAACIFALARLPQLVFFSPLLVYAFREAFPWDRPRRGTFGERSAPRYRFWENRARLLLTASGPAVLAALLLYRLFCLQSPGRCAFAAGGVCMALLLFEKTDSYERLAADYRSMHDDGTEKELLLKKENQALIDRQNYEIYSATLSERNRIAREIHDNVGHMLTRSILMVGALKAVSRSEAEQAPLALLDETLNSAMNSIRESVHNLHGQSIQLERSLQKLAENFLFCPVTLQFDMPEDVPSELKYCIIAVTKEALVNISRHSNATLAKITVREHPAFYQFSVRDNGSTFCPDGCAPQGIGIQNMRQRVAALHGAFQIHTDNGFCIYITIPK